jgi:hypothetical protein
MRHRIIFPRLIDPPVCNPVLQCKKEEGAVVVIDSNFCGVVFF